MSLKKVGERTIDNRHVARCHCGVVELLIHLPDGLVSPSRCDCSICRRRGAIVCAVPLEDLTVQKGAEFLTLYQFNTHTARHYFCSVCGIYTHHQLRSNPDQYEFNVGCLDGVNPLLIENVILYDGVNHPSDQVSND